MILHNLKIQFNHNMLTRTTSCHHITDVMDSKTNIAIGARAKCSIGDQFCREKGRKLSLRRLLKTLDIPREERALIWEAYRIYPVGKGGKVKWNLKKEKRK